MPVGRAIQLNGVDYITTDRNVRLNGETHKVPVEEYQPEVFVDQFDTSGGQSQQQLRGKDSQIFPNFMLGFGRNLIASDSARNINEYRRFFDATADTRFEKIYLPILEEDSTETGLEVVRAFADFKGGFCALWEDNTGVDVVARTYTGSTTTWGGGGNVIQGTTTGDERVASDLMAHKTRLIALVVGDATAGNAGDSQMIFHSTNGATWNAATTQITANLLANGVGVHEDINAGLLAEVGSELVATVWDEDSGTIRFFSSTDIGTTMVSEASNIIPSSDGPHGVAVYPGIDGLKKLYVLAMEGLWEVDTAPGTWTADMIFPTPGGVAVYGRRMMVGDDGALWFSVGVDDDTPAAFYRMVVEGDSRIITPVGLNLGDGVVSDMLGSVRYMTSAGGFQWAAIGGGKASRNARLVCWNSRGWHSMRRHGTENQKIEAIGISGRDDNLVRLHYGIRTGTGTSDTVFLGQPLVNPASGVSIKREASGFIDLPYIDGGMPLINAAWLRFGINASLLSADNTGEFIQMKYGLNGASRTTSPATAFEFVSGTLSQRLPSGSNSGQGETARNIGARVTLNRDGGTDTDTPELEDVIVTYLKQPPIQEGFRVTIDIDASAKKQGKGATTNKVWDVLKTARDLGTLNKYRYAEVTTDQYVKIRNIDWFPKQRSGARASAHAASDPLIQRSGYAVLTLEEVDAD